MSREANSMRRLTEIQSPTACWMEIDVGVGCVLERGLWTRLDDHVAGEASLGGAPVHCEPPTGGESAARKGERPRSTSSSSKTCLVSSRVSGMSARLSFNVSQRVFRPLCTPVFRSPRLLPVTCSGSLSMAHCYMPLGTEFELLASLSI